MKRLLLAIFMAFTLTTQADVVKTITKVAETTVALADSAKVAVVTTANTVDTSRLSKQVYADFKQALAGIASALKVGVEHVYIVLVKQQVVKAITWLLISLILILVPLIWMGKIWRQWKIEMESTRDGGAFILGLLAILVVLAPMISGFVCLFGNFDIIVTGFVNPEYGAMTDIMNFIEKIRAK